MSEIAQVYHAIEPMPRRQAFDPDDPERQDINPTTLFDSTALFSQVVVAPKGRIVSISGLIGVTADNRLVGDDMASQIAQAFENLRAALHAAGVGADGVVKLNVYVADYHERDLVLLRAQIERLFARGRYPALTLVPVPRLGRPGSLFEVDAVAVIAEAAVRIDSVSPQPKPATGL